MSDSESDLLPSNVYTFQNENTMISAKGPSINNANMTNLSFRNNVMTSTMHMPRNFERQGYGEPSLGQRSMYYRRETSPVSMYSGSETRMRNYHQSFYRGGMGSQRSMYYGRSGSPMSMRSMGSNMSVSAVDIAMAFKNETFNKHDLRMIKDAYNKFMKRRIRKKIEKRRNMRLFLRGYRRKSGYDSGEQGSDSSISSDDCKSTSSAMYKDNMSCRSTRTDITDFRRAIRESTMYRDCSDSFKQNAFKNMFSVPSANARDRFNATQNGPPMPQNEFAVPNPVNGQKSAFTQKERFKSGYLLPSQRFNKSVASVPILERDPRLQARQKALNAKMPINIEMPQRNGHVNAETDSDQEEIFSEVTVREKSTQESQYEKITDQGKRGLEIDDDKCSDKKRPKLSSPLKQTNKAKDLLKDKNTNQGPKVNKKINDKNKKDSEDTNEKVQNTKVSVTQKENTEEFEFLKPQFPVRKSGPAKIKEKLISKSAPPLIDDIIPTNKPVEIPETISKAPETQSVVEEQSDVTQNSNTDLSMRPSFIKRKLFTQKMDVTERKNLSNGAINVNSPQTNVYSAIHKEKHKARKLVTNQSCLSRDIAQEGNHLLDLIHKIVPADRMNMTNATNKTSVSHSVSNKNLEKDDDKWDVTSVISTCNNDDVSDTYTDEEIFANETMKKADGNIKTKESVNKQKENETKKNDVQKPKDNKKCEVTLPRRASECRILVEKLPHNKLMANLNVVKSKPLVPVQENDYNKKSVYNCVKSFWDTDFESDIESPAPKRPVTRPEPERPEVKENQNRSNIVEERNIPKSNKNKTLNVSLASVSESIKSRTMPTNNLGKLKKFNISKTLSIKSYLTPKQLKSKPVIAEEDKVISNKDDTPDNTTIEPVKKNTKQNKNLKSAKESDTGNEKTDAKKTNVQKNGKIETPNKKTTQSKAKSAKAQNAKPNKTIVNKSITTARSVRTPKRKTCCEEDDDKNKSAKSSATKTSGSKQKEKVSSVNKKPKLDKSPENAKSNTKGKAASKMNESISKTKNAKGKSQKAIKNNKNVEEPEAPKNFAAEPINRTLRSRRIDLSSSINSSTENITLQIRSLRTRRVDLSNSLKNSSLDETIMKRGQSKNAAKKTNTNLNRTEITRKPRSLKNQR